MANELTLRLEFGESSSKQYPKALSRVKNFPIYGRIQDGEDSNYIELSGSEIFSNYGRLDKLWKIVSGWRSASLQVNGKRTTIGGLYSINSIAKCMSERESSLSGEEYCTDRFLMGNWGCKSLRSVSLLPPESPTHSTEPKAWYRYGRFDENGKWMLSISSIKDKLLSEADFKNANLCPFFDIKRLDEKLSTIPDSIDPESSEDWEVVYEDVFIGSEVQKRPHHIELKALLDRDERLLASNLKISYGRSSSGFTISANDSNDYSPENEVQERNIPAVTFEEIGGIDDIIEKVREVIELPLKQPELLNQLHIRPHKGVLLYGPPGCGKTLIAKAIAKEVNAHFISIQGPELLSKYHAESEENLRAIYRQAQQLRPSIIYFDEIDSVAQKRADGENSRIDAKFVNQLLTLMDGVEDYDGVCVIASTNRPDLLDTALLRPGRFDYKLEVSLPNINSRIKIFNIHIKDMPLDGNFDVEYLANLMDGFSGADIAFVVREGAYNALRRTQNISELVRGDSPKILADDIFVTQADVEKAIQEMVSP